MLSALLLGFAAGCQSRLEPPPATAVLTSAAGGWTAQTTRYTNKQTGAVRSESKQVPPHTVRATYGTDGSYTTATDKSVAGTGADKVDKGTYSFSASNLTVVVNGSYATSRTEALTSTTLTLVTTDDTEPVERSVTTDTFAR